MGDFELTIRFPGGGPLIGGAATCPQGFHASHAALPDGQPYIPATALRGALREALEAVLRGSGEHRACAGGDGLDPSGGDAAMTGKAAHGSCELGSEGTPCLACRLFGTRRAQIGPGERAFSGLVLGDASLAREASWTTRPVVAIDRARRSASDQQLVFQRIPHSVEQLAFIARGRVSDPALAKYLEVATRATKHIGSGRSRGLGRVELDLAWRNAEPPSHTGARVVPEGDLLLRVTLTSPMLVGAPTIDGNHRETRHEIPGSTVRGAIGFALRELLEDADRDPGTQDLLDAERGARFGFLDPADATRREASEETDFLI